MRNNNFATAGLLAAVLVLTAAVAPAEPWGPWSVSTDAEVMLTSADRGPSAYPRSEGSDHSIAAAPFLLLLRFYQTVISPLDGDRCPMYPTCSEYSVQAIRKHGPFIGVVMTADRLIHEEDEQRFAPLDKVGDRYRFIDPVADNDFWWHAP